MHFILLLPKVMAVGTGGAHPAFHGFRVSQRDMKFFVVNGLDMLTADADDRLGIVVLMFVWRCKEVVKSWTVKNRRHLEALTRVLRLE